MNAPTGMVQYSVKDVWQMATIIAKGGLFGVKTIEQAASIMLIAQAEGLHPAIAARDYHIIQGKACLKADAMLARFQQAGGVCQWECVSDAKVAALFSHPTKSPKPVLIEWNNETVKQAKITSEMHQKYPRQMKRARVISEGVRTVLPECVCGVYAPEEIATKAAEIDALEKEAAETIKPADVIIQDTPSPFPDDTPTPAPKPSAKPQPDAELAPETPVLYGWETIDGKKKPRMKPVTDMTDEELDGATQAAEAKRGDKKWGQAAEANLRLIGCEVLKRANAKLPKQTSLDIEKLPAPSNGKHDDPGASPPAPEKGAAAEQSEPAPVSPTYGERLAIALNEAGMEKVIARKVLCDKIKVTWPFMQDVLSNREKFAPETLAALEANGVSVRELK